MALYPFYAYTVDAQGDITTGTAVEVRDAAGDLATLYNQDGTSLTNPFTSGADADVLFYAAQGTYAVTTGSGASEQTVTVQLGPIVLDDVDAVIADSSLAYSPTGNQRPVVAGNVIRTDAEGFAYEVAASGASDEHVTTSGGVKLYVLAGTAVHISALDLSSIVPASTVEALLGVASTAGVSLVLDADFTLSGDVLVDEKVHIYLAPSATVSMQNSPTWDNGQGAADGTRYAAGMFTLRTGADGSVFEAHGAFDVNEASAGSVSGETVQPAAVLVFGAHDVTLKGCAQINNTFNGVTIVDSDRLVMTDEWRATDAANAVVDLEASDDFIVRAYANGGEEAVDVQVYCVGGMVYARAKDTTQASLEINNSANITGHIKAVNARGYYLFNYASGSSATQRWSQRGRSHRDNAGITVHHQGWFDSTFSNSGQFIVGRVDGCDGYKILSDVFIEGVTGRIDRVYDDAGGPDCVGGSVSIKMRSDTNTLTDVDELYRLEGARDLYFEHDTEFPLPSDNRAVYVSGTDQTVVKTLSMRSGGNGYNLAIAGNSPDLIVIDAYLAQDVQGAVDMSGVSAGFVEFLPYLKGAAADLPANPETWKLINGQAWWNTDERRFVYANRNAGHWSYTDQLVTAAGSDYATGTDILPGYVRVTGADGTKGVSLPTAADTHHPIWIMNNDATSALKIFNDNNENGAVQDIPASKLGVAYPDADWGKWIVMVSA